MIIRRQNRTKIFSIVLSFLMLLSMISPALAADNGNQSQRVLLESQGNNETKKLPTQLTNEFEEDEQVTFLIKFKEKADLKEAVEKAQRSAEKNNLSAYRTELLERSHVITELKTVAQVEQANVTQYLESEIKNNNVSDYESFYIVNGMAITATQEVAEQLLTFPEVAKVLPNELHQLHEVEKTGETVKSDNEVEWNIKRVGAPEVWDMGYDGKGVVVAVIDSGAQWDHPALKHSYRGYDVETGEVDHTSNWYDATYGEVEPYDDIGHGTHVTGTVTGAEPDGTNKVGVAPGAKWIHVKAFTNAGGTDADLIRAAQWVLAPTDENGNPDPTKTPDVVNNSWGGGPGIDDWYRDIVRAWREVGIFPEFSAGNITLYNPGGPGSVAVPANYPESFATGSININDEVADTSLRGPSPYDGIMKPDIAAPGVNIRSAVPGGGYEDDWSGTSMAGPAVSGVAALLLQADSSLKVHEVEEILKETATPLTDKDYPESPNNGYGHGLVDAYTAVLSVTEGLGTVEGNVLGYDGTVPLQAEVTAVDGERSRSAKTDADTGSYHLKYAIGEFTFTAEAYGHETATKTANVLEDEIVNVDFTLEELSKGTVEGTIKTKSTGKPVEDATLYLLEDAKVAPVETDENGDYSLTAYEGEYTLRIVANDHHMQEIPVSIEQGQLTIDIELEPYYTYLGEEIGYDSESPDTAMALYQEGAGFAVKMSLPEGRDQAIVTGGKFFFVDESFPNPGGTEFLVEVWDSSGEDGLPGERIGGPVEGEAIRDRKTWTDVDLFTENIVVDDDFYMVYIQKNEVPYVPGLAIDQTALYSQRNFLYFDGEWEQEYADTGNFMIRSQVSYEIEEPIITNVKEHQYTNEDSIEISGVASPTTTVTFYNNEEVVGEQTIGDDSTFSLTVPLQVGDNDITAVATYRDDTVGSSETVKVTYDNVAPELTVDTPGNDYVTNKSAVTVSGSVTDNYGVETVTINDKAVDITNDTYSSRVILEEGENNIVVTATDLAGNEASNTLSVTKKSTEPVIENLQPENNVYTRSGEDVKVSFTSDVENGEAKFAVQLAGFGSTQNFDNDMTEVSPGIYEGTWAIPENANLQDVAISVKITDSLGNDTVQTADGKVFVANEAVNRISGKTRFGTAVEVSQKGWTSADTVVLARSDDFADALAGVPLAYQLDAPILLTRSNKLMTETLDEIKRLGAENVVILGGTEAINEEVVTTLTNEQLNVERVRGSTRYDTAAEIAKRVAPNGSEEVVVVNGVDFPDALSAASHAAKKGMPILLSRTDSLPEVTESMIESLQATKTYVVGGTLAVSELVMKDLPDAVRLSGKDRYKTNIAVNEHFGIGSNWLYVATGTDFADALTGTVLAAKHDTSILLVRDKVTEDMKNIVTNYNVNNVSLLGGTIAIPEKVERSLKKLLEN